MAKRTEPVFTDLEPPTARAWGDGRGSLAWFRLAKRRLREFALCVFADHVFRLAAPRLTTSAGLESLHLARDGVAAALRVALGTAAHDDAGLSAAEEAIRGHLNVRATWELNLLAAGLCETVARSAANRPEARGESIGLATQAGFQARRFSDNVADQRTRVGGTQHDFVVRMCGLPPHRETLLRVAHRLDPAATPIALLEWAERAGDGGRVVCDLIAERGWTDAAIEEVRRIVGAPPSEPNPPPQPSPFEGGS